MMNTTALDTVRRFRQAVYQSLGHRKDSLFELLEAALVAPVRSTLVRLSLTAAFRRRWPSTGDALAEGQVKPARPRAVLHATLPEPEAPARPLWAGDGTTWPRPAAKTSPGRTLRHPSAAVRGQGRLSGHFASPGIPQDSLIVGWEYEWLVAVPAPGTSWVLPRDVRRRAPASGTPTELAIRELRAALARRPAEAARPVGLYDSADDPVQFARAKLALDVLVRRRTRRKFFGPPGPYRGRGPRPKHGPECKLWDETTHPPPAQSASLEDPTHGPVRVDIWPDQHVQGAHDVPFTVVRVQSLPLSLRRVERLPRHARTPKPLWLAWVGGELPADLHDLWRWYTARFTIEHGCRFLKQDLGWTTVRPRDPRAADRWSWLLALAFWQLWLARSLVAFQRLPWERPLSPARLTPGRVRRALALELSRVGTPARPVRRRGISPGRRPGERQPPRKRYLVARRRPKRVA